MLVGHVAGETSGEAGADNIVKLAEEVPVSVLALSGVICDKGGLFIKLANLVFQVFLEIGVDQRYLANAVF